VNQGGAELKRSQQEPGFAVWANDPVVFKILWVLLFGIGCGLIAGTGMLSSLESSPTRPSPEKCEKSSKGGSGCICEL
jgi:hypothetical protein